MGLFSIVGTMRITAANVHRLGRLLLFIACFIFPLVLQSFAEYCKISEFDDAQLVERMVEYYNENPEDFSFDNIYYGSSKSEYYRILNEIKFGVKIKSEDTLVDYMETNGISSVHDLNECIFLNDDHIAEMTPVFIVSDLNVAQSVALSMNMTFISSSIRYAQYIINITNFDGFCSSSRSKRMQQIEEPEFDYSTISPLGMMTDLFCYVVSSVFGSSSGSNSTAVFESSLAEDEMLYNKTMSQIEQTTSIIYEDTGYTSPYDYSEQRNTIVENRKKYEQETRDRIGRYYNSTRHTTPSHVTTEKIPPPPRRDVKRLLSERIESTLRNMTKSFGEMAVFRKTSKFFARIFNYPDLFRVSLVSLKYTMEIHQNDLRHMRKGVESLYSWLSNNDNANQRDNDPKTSNRKEKIGSLSYMFRFIKSEVGFQTETGEWKARAQRAFEYIAYHQTLKASKRNSTAHSKEDKDAVDDELYFPNSYYKNHLFAENQDRRRKYFEKVQRFSYVPGNREESDADGSNDQKYYFVSRNERERTRKRHATRERFFIFSVATYEPFEGYAPWQNNMVNLLSIKDLMTWGKKWLEWFFVNTDETKSSCDFPFPLMPSSEFSCRTVQFYPVSISGFSNPETEGEEDSFDYTNPRCEEYESNTALAKGWFWLLTYKPFYIFVQAYPKTEPVMRYLMYDTDGSIPSNLSYCIPFSIFKVIPLIFLVCFLVWVLSLVVDLYSEYSNHSTSEVLALETDSVKLQLLRTNRRIESLYLEMRRKDDLISTLSAKAETMNQLIYSIQSSNSKIQQRTPSSAAGGSSIPISIGSRISDFSGSSSSEESEEEDHGLLSPQERTNLDSLSRYSSMYQKIRKIKSNAP